MRDSADFGMYVCKYVWLCECMVVCIVVVVVVRPSTLECRLLHKKQTNDPACACGVVAGAGGSYWLGQFPRDEGTRVCHAV